MYGFAQNHHLTGREQQSDVIAYQVCQSFKPGEITPEEANRVGYAFAVRFLKGRHAFLVAAHTDTRHIHNHIIWNSTGWTASGSFGIFLAPAGMSHGSATPSAPSTGCPSSQRPSAGKITTASGWVKDTKSMRTLRVQRGLRGVAPDKQRGVFAAAETARKAKWVPLCPACHVFSRPSQRCFLCFPA